MKKNCFRILAGMVLWLGMTTQCFAWGWKSAPTPEDVQKFLSGTAPYQSAVTDAKMAAVYKNGRTEFAVFYTKDPKAGPARSWGWKRSTEPNDVMNFLNGKGAYKYPVKRARICAVYNGKYTDFIIFYQRGDSTTPAGNWKWKLATTVYDALNYLNGSGAYKQGIKEAEIATIWQINHLRFYIFGKTGSKTQLKDHWQCKDYSQPDQVMNAINGPANFPIPAKDNKIISAAFQNSKKYYLFRPQGYLIVTRNMFVNELNDYISWKQNHGFDVYTMTAEWINASLDGGDIRYKIRKAIRSMHSHAKVNYAVLIGDSVDVITAPDATTYQEPPTPQLNEPWNLPAGYYRWEVWNNPQYTSLYYADLNNKSFYTKDEYYWDGEYRIYTGLMPVRTVEELRKILNKTMTYQKSKTFTFVYSWDLYSDEAEQTYDAIKTIVQSAGCSITKYLFNESASASTIHNKLFERTGIIYEGGHGNVGIFKIGNTVINKSDCEKYKQINPLFIASSCSIQAFHLGESLDEAFIKGEKGPAVISTSPPWGSKPHGVVMSDQNKGYWEDLAAGKSIGQAFYDHCKGAWQNPLHLFGDPSLVIVGE